MEGAMADETEPPVNKGGRPPKPERERGVQVTLRIPAALLEQLELEAAELAIPLATHIKSILQQRENERLRGLAR